MKCCNDRAARSEQLGGAWTTCIRERRLDAAPDVLHAACTSMGVQHKAPPDTRTGQSAQACRRPEVPAGRWAHNHARG